MQDTPSERDYFNPAFKRRPRSEFYDFGGPQQRQTPIICDLVPTLQLQLSTRPRSQYFDGNQGIRKRPRAQYFEIRQPGLTSILIPPLRIRNISIVCPLIPRLVLPSPTRTSVEIRNLQGIDRPTLAVPLKEAQLVEANATPTCVQEQFEEDVSNANKKDSTDSTQRRSDVFIMSSLCIPSISH